MIDGHAWSDWLEVGDFDLDNDHHLQMRLSTSLVDALEEGRPWLARRLADHLHDSSALHFEGEEHRMRRLRYPGKSLHQAEHDALLARMEELDLRLDEEDWASALASALEIRSALAAHIGSADRRLADHGREAGAEQASV